MKEGFFSGGKYADKHLASLKDDDMNPDEMVGQIEPEGEEFINKMDRESKRAFEDLGFKIGDQIQRYLAGDSGAIKRGKITKFTYAMNPQAIFLAGVKDENNVSFVITPDDILEGRVKKI
ncbi:MAG: hypothetical protein HYT15_03530 [Candidatus Magasanikbacteria bacterium]|nr:hypothetical protein [Candidatus Magasanikbacteria bacterium]